MESDQLTLFAGGFPCQDVSTSGEKAGIVGARSGLWSEFARLISEIRPRYVIVENVTGLLARGLGEVLRDLAQVGYDAEWEVISAESVGSFQLRERVWILAYPEGERRESVYDQSSVLRETIAHCARLAGDRRTFYAPDAQRLLWETEPKVVRVADGFPGRVGHIKQLGNAVVPQVVEVIGNAIIEAA